MRETVNLCPQNINFILVFREYEGLVSEKEFKIVLKDHIIDIEIVETKKESHIHFAKNVTNDFTELTSKT